MHARPGAGTVHQLDRTPFEHARADPPQHILGALPLEDNGIDTRKLKQPPEHQPGRPRTDDHHLRARFLLLACCNEDASNTRAR